jgi:FlaA1/EpsC-like NDP-sugar epimerase
MSWNLTPRTILILAHDLLAAAAAVPAALYLRLGAVGVAERCRLLLVVLPGFVACAAGVVWFGGLFRNKWRFTSLPDALMIIKAATALALGLLAVDHFLPAPSVHGGAFFGKRTIVLYWFLQIFFLSGLRVVYRWFRHARTLRRARQDGLAQALVLGPAAEAEVLLRGIESGAVRKLHVAGVLSPTRSDRSQSIRGIPVLGSLEDLERAVQDLARRGTTVTRLVMTPSALAPEMKPEALLARARRAGLTPGRMPGLEEGGDALRLAPIQVEDLLVRPAVKIDYRRLEEFVRGKAAVVTGGGGSIGSEICGRLATFGIARLMIVENSEPALHAALEALKDAKPFGAGAGIDGRIADIRDRDRITRLVTGFRPDIVFHAAALKHVPILERDWEEGVKTNVFGSVNVADAAVASGAAAMVMISTDKAVEPVSVLGATKRFAEMYCQALDTGSFPIGSIDTGSPATESRARTAGPAPTRLIAVRFGNVLASTGSVMPKFRRQIETGGPVTVTHPGMVRYFMTIREACDLVVTAASHALTPPRSGESVYVLNMGQPVRIVDLAGRMIRLSGLEPGRDIEIVFTGVRPGERLNEILLAADEPVADIGIDGIVAARPISPGLDALRRRLAELEQALKDNDREAACRALRDALF